MTDLLSVELRDITSIKPYEKNPRLNDKAVDSVTISLKEFGFRQPIVVDTNSVIIAGDTVLDPFSGSGTTGVVCRRLNRNFIGIEKVPEYAKLARERIFATNPDQ